VISSGTGWWALGVAIAGVVLSLASLGWQAFSFTRSGSRVEVESGLCTRQKDGGTVKFSPDYMPTVEQLIAFGKREDQTQLTAIIRNTGRLAVTVVSCSWRIKSPMFIGGTTEFPHRLEPHDQFTATVDLFVVIKELRGEGAVPIESFREVWPVVTLANGKNSEGST
jgi:hypothetical protein